MFENTENKQLDWRIRQSFGVYTVSQSRSVVTSAENPAPDNSPQSIGELRNGCYLCSSLELRCVSLIDDAQNMLN